MFLLKKITALFLMAALVGAPFSFLFQTGLPAVVPAGSRTALAQTGISNNFYVKQSFDVSEREKVSSQLIHTSKQAYFFTDNAYYFGLNSSGQKQFKQTLEELGEEFDRKIYPRLRDVYGSEWKPGIDNDEKITVFVGNMKEGVNGYVLPRDEKSRSEEPKSNKREMIYLNSSLFSPDQNKTAFDTAKTHLAHEFVHLIEYNEKNRKHEAEEKRWLSEALAEYAPTLLGYNKEYDGSYLEKRVDDFLASPSESLIEWNGENADFASSNLFAHYLTGRYGTQALGRIMSSPKTGAEAVESVFSQDVSFQDIFSDWQTTNYVNGATENHPDKYKYKNSNLNYANLHIGSAIQYTVLRKRDISSTFNIDQGSADRLKFTPGVLGNTEENTLKIEFESSPRETNFRVSLVITDIQGKSRIEHLRINKEGDGVKYVEDFGASVLSVAMIPANFDKRLSINGELGSYSINVSLQEDKGEVKGTREFADGSLLSAEDGSKVYVIKKPSDGSGQATKRWIPTAEIFNGYGHLRWEDIIEVNRETLEEFETSRLIRFRGDPRVYEVSSDGTIKRWLNITPEQFNASGRSWDAIYEVNKREFEEYSTGNPITG